MSLSYLSANMSLVIPVPTQELSPNWAYDLNASLTIVDAHNHVPGSGVQIPTAGININADLSFNNAYNLIGLRSTRYFVQNSALVGASDLSCASSVGTDGDLYWNDANGNAIRITQSGSVAGASGTITGLPSGTASASYQSVSGTFQFQQATSTGANIDGATLVIRYPGSYPTPAGNYIALQAPSSLASGYAITLPALPGQTNVVTLASDGTLSSTTWDAIGTNMTSVGADAVANTRTRSTGTTVAAGGVAISASCGSFSTSSGTYVAVTNLSVTITTTGRPVRLSIEPAKANSVFSITGATGASSQLRFLRDSVTVVGVGNWSHTTGVLTVSPFLGTTDAVAAGTYTYIVQMLEGLSVGATLSNAVLVAYEL